jgi:hypothetical protein
VEKTFLRLNREISIMILSGVVILFSFLSGYSPITNFISFLFVFIKSFLFLIIPLLFYILEKKDMELKKVAGIYASYFIIDLFITIITSVSVVNGVIPGIWKTLFDLVNLIILLSSLFILIEQILLYSDIRSKVYSNTIMKIVYFVGNTIAYPFLAFINKRINKNDE